MKAFVIYRKSGSIMFWTYVDEGAEASDYGVFLEEVEEGKTIDSVDLTDPNQPKLTFMEDRTEESQNV